MYKEIPGYPNYLIDKEGNVLSLSTGVIRKPWVNRDGYPQITLYGEDGRRNTFEIHRLLGMTWLEKPEEEGDWEIDHIDRNKENNDLSNLR